MRREAALASTALSRAKHLLRPSVLAHAESLHARSKAILKKALLLMAPPDVRDTNAMLSSLQYMKVLGKGKRPYYSPNESRVIDPLVMKVMSEISPSLLKRALRYEMSTATMRRIYAAICRYDRRDIPLSELDSDAVQFATSMLYKTMSVPQECRHVFDARCAELMNISSPEHFELVPHDKTTSPGLPGLELGIKKKADDFPRASTEAYDFYRTGSYTSYDWVVYAKSKENPVDKVDKGVRTIVATSYSGFLLGSCAALPYNEYMNTYNQKLPTGVGSSWYHSGAERLCDFFSVRPSDHAMFDEADISAWDKLPSFLQSIVCEFRLAQVNWSLISEPDVWKTLLRARYQDIGHPIFRMPDGTRIASNGGQCSGHESTSHDNSLMHYWLQAYCFHRALSSASLRRRARLLRTYGTLDPMTLFSLLKMKLYGDDSLVLKPTELSKVYTLTKFCLYAQEAGFEAKLAKCKRSPCLSQATYLSRQVIDLLGHAVPWRPSLNTAIRLLFGSYTGSYTGDLSEAYARYIGHYYDNFFNTEIRKLIEVLVTHLPPNIVPSFGKAHTYRLRDIVSALGGKFPDTFPSRQEVCDLYGVPLTELHSTVEHSAAAFAQLNSLLLRPWRRNITTARKVSSAPDLWRRLDTAMFNNSYYRKAHDNLKAKYRTTPLRREAIVGGHAGLKYLECFKVLNIPHSSKGVIDYGCHPGSGLNAICRWFEPATFIFGVSLKPPQDRLKPFCYKLRDSSRAVLYEMDVRHCTNISLEFDVACCDVTSTSLVQEDAHTLTIVPVLEGILAAKHLRYSVFKMRGIVSPLSLEYLYRFYCAAEEFHIVKPRYSYAWSSEVYVAVKFGFCPNLVSKGVFDMKVFSFMNDLSVFRAAGFSALLNNTKGHRVNPKQFDRDYQSWNLEAIGFFDSDYLCF